MSYVCAAFRMQSESSADDTLLSTQKLMLSDMQAKHPQHDMYMDFKRTHYYSRVYTYCREANALIFYLHTMKVRSSDAACF